MKRKTVIKILIVGISITIGNFDKMSENWHILENEINYDNPHTEEKKMELINITEKPIISTLANCIQGLEMDYSFLFK